MTVEPSCYSVRKPLLFTQWVTKLGSQRLRALSFCSSVKYPGKVFLSVLIQKLEGGSLYISTHHMNNLQES